MIATGQDACTNAPTISLSFESTSASIQITTNEIVVANIQNRTKERSKSSAKFKALVEANTKVAPKWLETNLEEMSAKVVALPAREDIDLEIAEHLIIELYSK